MSGTEGHGGNRQAPRLVSAGEAGQREAAQPPPREPVTRTLLTLHAVATKFGVSERTAHKLIASDWFPAPLELAPRVRRWVESEIDDAVAKRAPRRTAQVEPRQLVQARVGRTGVPA
jgi:predicted DNA-binding transcriptional regulator AlpA